MCRQCRTVKCLQVRRDLAGLQQFDYALQSTDIWGVEALRRFGAEGLMA